jgi:hypothetical protein
MLVALNQRLDKFQRFPEGKILVNSTAVRETRGDERVIASPIGELLARSAPPAGATSTFSPRRWFRLPELFARGHRACC